MSEHSDDSVPQQRPSLKAPQAATQEAIARMQRAKHMRVRFPRLERICRPQLENFWVIGGRPGEFKTTLQLNIALNAVENRLRGLFVSLEMTPADLAMVALSKRSRITRHRIEEAMVAGSRVPFTAEEDARWQEALAWFEGLSAHLRIHGAEEHGRDIEDVLRSACRARFDIVLVDHLGMIGRDSGGHELVRLSDAIHKLRGLSRGEVVAGYRPLVIATSQLSRGIDGREDEEHIPRLADFRGSARIEHDSDVVIGLVKRKATEEGTNMLDAFVLKNRNGPAPEVLLLEANGSIGLVTERTLTFPPLPRTGP